MLTSKQRAFLRSLANDIDTIVMVGKGNMSEQIIKQAVGSKFVLFRRNSEKPVIELPKAKKKR